MKREARRMRQCSEMSPEGGRDDTPGDLIPAMRLVLIVALSALLAGCGSSSAVLTLKSTEAAVRSAGYARLSVIDASAAVARLRSEGFDVTGLRVGTPDYIFPRSVPIISVLRFTTVDRAERVANKRYVARVCNVVVYNGAQTIKIAREAAARIVAQLRTRCR